MKNHQETFYTFGQSVRVEKYRRNWAVYVDESLLAVAVYKKGAFAIATLAASVDAIAIAKATGQD